MKLRFFQTYDENGVESKPELQFLDEDSMRWKAVPWVRVKELFEEHYMQESKKR